MDMDARAPGYVNDTAFEPEPTRCSSSEMRSWSDGLQIAGCLAPELRWFYEWMLGRVATAIGVDIELVDDCGYDAWQRSEGAFICSLAYVDAADAGWLNGRRFSPVAAPVPVDRRCGGRPTYFSEVIVRRDAPWSTFGELRGRRWSYNETGSQSGYGVTRYQLVAMGETNGFFGEVVDAGFHGRSVELLLDGEIDASAIDSHLWSVMLRERPELRRDLKAIDVLGPSTIQPLVLAENVPTGVRRRFERALLNLADERSRDSEAADAFEAACIERWVPVRDRDYADVRRMRDACHEANFLTLR